MPTEQLANNALTTLVAAIDAEDTSLSVVSHTAFPSAAQFRVLVHDELLLVTAGAGSSTWTVTRGIEGTTPASHASGSTVAHVLTAGALDAFVHAPTGVAPGSYSSANITIAPDGRITAASDGSSSGPWTLLNTVTPSGVGTASLTIPSGYKHVMVIGSDMYSSLYQDSEYHYLTYQANGVDGTIFDWQNTSYVDWRLSGGCAITGWVRGYNVYPQMINFRLRMLYAGVENYGKLAVIDSVWSGNDPGSRFIAYRHNNRAAVSSLDFFMSGGALYGTLKLYGSNQETI